MPNYETPFSVTWFRCRNVDRSEKPDRSIRVTSLVKNVLPRKVPHVIDRVELGAPAWASDRRRNKLAIDAFNVDHRVLVLREHVVRVEVE